MVAVKNVLKNAKKDVVTVLSVWLWKTHVCSHANLDYVKKLACLAWKKNVMMIPWNGA